VLSDTWRLDETTWTRESASAPLSNRLFSPLVYDPARRRSVMFGGRTIGGASFDDTWQWDGMGWQQQAIADTPPPRGGHVTFPGPDGRGIVIFGGEKSDDGTRFDDTWRLRFENAAATEQCLLSVDDDRDDKIGCADPDCWSRCAPLCPPGAATCDAAAPHCGDGSCNTALESCRNCPQDCATCAAACGDTFCDAPETLATCPGDCTP
jgi:hypothetical protein